MADTNELQKTFTAMPFQANGAGLTLSAVAAGNIFTDGAYQGAFTAPAWFFLAGLVLAYLLFAVTSKLDLNSRNMLIAQSFRRTAMKCEVAEHPTERMKEIAVDCTARADALDASQLPSSQIAMLTRATNWLNNLSLGCFVVGAIIGLTILARG